MFSTRIRRSTLSGMLVLAALPMPFLASGTPLNLRTLSASRLLQSGPGWPAKQPTNGRLSISKALAAAGGTLDTKQFYNWSGYAAVGATFTKVTGTVVVPTVTCPVDNAYTVMWTGFDGFDNATVEQDGIAALCGHAGTAPTYFAWWEMFPTNTIQWINSLPVKPGDVVRSNISFARPTYTLSVANLTTGRQYTTKQRCAAGLVCSRDSAEWIVERPTTGLGDLFPLADWKTSRLYANQAAIGGHELAGLSSLSNYAINMVDPDSDHLLARVGPVRARAKAFTDSWLEAQ
jgi:hypothetical protein